MPWDWTVWPALAAIGACLLDYRLGEPRRYHPLVIFGRWAETVRQLNRSSDHHPMIQRMAGIAMMSMAVLPWVSIAYLLASLPVIGELCSMGLLYLCIGHQSLREHVLPIAAALNKNDIATAKTLTARIVSRDPDKMEPTTAAVESVLENGTDGVFATLFWFFIAGAAGAVLYRLVNTLDAMWGYKTPQWRYIGWGAARFDDLLNYIPARLTAISYALLGDTQRALRCWRMQAAQCASPNGGPVMCAGAGALGLQLGGPTWYHGQCVDKPIMGEGKRPNADSIIAALRLVKHTLMLWLTVAFVGYALWGQL